MLIRILLALSVALWAVPVGAQALDVRCGEAPDGLLAMLTAWCQSRDSSLDLAFVTSTTGAGLTVAYDNESGFHVAAHQKLRWPGNLLAAMDSTYAPFLPAGWNAAESLLVARALSGQSLLIFGPRAAVVTGADTSLGAPWFFMVLCDSGQADTPIWDARDLRQRWWRWTDLTAANSIWPLAAQPSFKLGRRVVRAAMRNLVLAARPDSTDSQRYGLAAVSLAKAQPDRVPGSAWTLSRIAALRKATAGYIDRVIELWPPAQRDPVKLAAFYLQKDAEAWQTLAAVSSDWTSYDAGQRTEWLTSLLDWETKAAVALDQMVSSPD